MRRGWSDCIIWLPCRSPVLPPVLFFDLLPAIAILLGLERADDGGRPGPRIDARVPFLDLAVGTDDDPDALRALGRIGVGPVGGTDVAVGVADQGEVEVELLGERPELVHHRPRVLDRAAQVAGAVGAVRAAAPVAAKDLLGPRGAPRVGAQIEAEVHGAHDRLRVAPLRLAPPVEHRALVGPVLRTDVGPVPPVGVLRGRAESALLAAAADPDRDAGLERLRVVGGVDHAEVLALEGDAPALGVEQQPHDLRVLLEHVLPRADRGERVPEGLGLHVVPARAEAAVDAAVGEMVDGGQGLGEQPGVTVGDAVDAAAEPDLPGVHGRRGQGRDGLVAVHVAPARRRLLEVVGDREPVEALRVGELPQLAHLVQGTAHVTDVDAELHLALLRAPQNFSCAPPPPNRPPSPAKPGSAPGARAAGVKAATTGTTWRICCRRSSEKSGSAVNPAISPLRARRRARSTTSARTTSSAPARMSTTQSGATWTYWRRVTSDRASSTIPVSRTKVRRVRRPHASTARGRTTVATAAARRAPRGRSSGLGASRARCSRDPSSSEYTFAAA